jgi:hypothetical protein
MAATYSPAAHTAPETAKIGTASVTGLSPGRVFTALNDQWAPTTIFLPTGTTADGFPGGMVPFTTGTGAVT